MAIFSKEYGSLSYESGDMIEDVKQDILEFGAKYPLYAVYRRMYGADFIIDYTYDINDIKSMHNEELTTTEDIVIKMTAIELLEKLKQQDAII